MLLDAGAQLDAAANQGWTPLLAAAQAGHAPVLRALLRWSAEGGVNRASEGGVTPLIAAGSFGHLEACEVLLEWGADATLQGPMGKSAAEWAEKRGHAAAAELLTKA